MSIQVDSYDAGRAAFWSGVSFEACPLSGSDRIDWECGWQDARVASLDCFINEQED